LAAKQSVKLKVSSFLPYWVMNGIVTRTFKPVNWSSLVMFALGFWLSSSLLLDCLIIPGLLTTGMMNETGFASASYSIFGTFNHIELICAALILSSSLIIREQHNFSKERGDRAIFGSIILLAIALIYTYFLTPQMSSMGMSLNWFEETAILPNSMAIMHFGYWSLEITKLILGTMLLRSYYRNSCSLL
jgi:hypothetical protein